MGLDGFSLRPLVNELNTALTGGRIDRILQPNKHTILMQIRQPGQNYLLHISILPQNPVINIIKKNIDNPPTPPVFCMVLRKQIEDGRIAAIRQRELDRSVEIDIDLRGAGGLIVTKTLIAELTGKYSNLILVQDNKIIDCLKKIGITTSRVRQILPAHTYEPPPITDTEINVFETPVDDFINSIKDKSAMKLSKAIIAAGIGIGPITAKELCWRAGLPKNILIGELTDSDFSSIANELTALIEQLNTPEEVCPQVIIDENKKLIGIAAFKVYHLKEHTAKDFATLSDAVDYSTEITGSYRIPEKELLKKLVSHEIEKATNKHQLLVDERTTALDAEQLRINADILMTYQYQITENKQDTQVTLPNLYSEKPDEDLVTIEIDPLISLSQNAQSYYNKYNKAKRAQEQLAIQLTQCQSDIDYLNSIESSLDTSSTLTEINEIKTELIQAGYIKEQKKKKMSEAPSKPLKITAPDGTTILVGKNNYQNDTLTCKTAATDDIWLHTKDIPGSHVIIRTEHNAVTEETLHLAAQLSAHFSKASASTLIPVDYTKRKYVKKPSGSKPGFVIYTNQRTLFVTPDEAVLEKYL